MREKFKIFHFILVFQIATGYRGYEENSLDIRKIDPAESRIKFNASIIESVGIALIRNPNINTINIHRESWHPVKLVYRLPTLKDFIVQSCPKSLHATLQSRMDNDAEMAMIAKEAEHLRKQFLHELRSDSPYISQRKRRNTTTANSSIVTSNAKMRARPDLNEPANLVSEYSQPDPTKNFESENSVIHRQEYDYSDSYSYPEKLTSTVMPSTTAQAEDEVLSTYPPANENTQPQNLEINPEIANEESIPSGFCNFNITESPIEALQFFMIDCNGFICCNQLTCKTAERRKTAAELIGEIIDAQRTFNQTERDVLRSKLSEISVCFKPPPFESQRSRKSLSFWQYWSRGGPLTPNSINTEIEEVENLENEQIHALSEKMLSRDVFNAAIESEESKLKLLSSTLCTISTELLGNSKINEMRNHYVQLEEKIERAVATCEQGNRPIGLSAKLLISLCMRLNPKDDRFCRDPTVLSKINCKAIKLEISETEIVFYIRIGMFEFLEDSVTTQIIATPFIDQSGRPFILTDVPKNIVETHRHLISTTCEKGLGDSISICSLRNAVDINANLACVNALTNRSKNLIKISCKKSIYRGDECIAYALPNNGYAVWSTKQIQVKAIARDNAFSKTIRVIKPNKLSLISEKNVNFYCNEIQYSTSDDTKEIEYETGSKIEVDIDTKNILNDEFGLFSDRLTDIEKKQIRDHNNATSLATSQLSNLLMIHPKHESKIKILFRSIIYLLAAISALWILKKITGFVIKKYNKYKRNRVKTFADILNNQLRPENPRTDAVITTQSIPQTISSNL